MSSGENHNTKKRPFKTTTSFYRKVKKQKLLQNFKFTRDSACISTVSNENSDHKYPEDQSSINLDNYVGDIRLLDNLNESDQEEEYCMEISEKCIEETEEKVDFLLEIKNWALLNKISHSALDGLLGLLRFNGFNFLPKDSRTLLQTPSYINTQTMGNGLFWYNGLKNSLKNILINTTLKDVSLIINIDGLPIASSSKKEFWPILCAIDGMQSIPIIVVAVYCGESKPALKGFLQPFVQEILPILKDGIFVKNKKFDVKIKCFVCDSPARAFIKGRYCVRSERTMSVNIFTFVGVVNFNSYHGCSKCTVTGEYEEYRMSFKRLHCSSRSDANFRNRVDDEHHKETSPLEALSIDMVKDFVVADSLHLFHLGIIKKLLLIWTN